jgi:hypothetical protein
LGSALTNTYGTASAGVSYTATGTNLTGQITNTPVTGWEISTNNSTWTTNATVVNTNTTVWVRTAATLAVGTNNSTNVVTLASSGATNTNVTTSASGNVVSQKGLTITGLTAADKNWDGTTTASVTGTPAYSGLVNGESFAVAGTVTWAFADANAGSTKTLTRTGNYGAPSSNYTVTQPTLTASINAVVPGAPTITGIAAGNAQLSVAFTVPSSDGGSAITNYKYSTDGGSTFTAVSPAATTSPITITGLSNGTSYNVQILAVNAAGDGTASTGVNGTPAAPAVPTVTVGSLSGALTTTYGTASAERTFTVSGSTLTNNLTVTAPTGLEVSTTSGSSFADSLNLTATSGTVSNTTVYVRLKSSAPVAGTYNNVSITITGGGDDKSVSTSTGNTVAPKVITITGLGATGKVYDGTTSVTITGTAAYGGLANGEIHSLTDSVIWTFPDKNVGAGKVLSRSASYTAPNANYSLSTQPSLTADITAKELTGSFTANHKAFDNSTTATVATRAVSGAIEGDTVNHSGGSATFADVNVGNGKTVTLAGATLTGGDAGNYTLTSVFTTTANITQGAAAITFGALPAGKKVGDAAFSAGATTTLGTISYTSSNTAVATVDAGTGSITLVAPGVTTITATVAGTANFTGSTTSQTLNVTGAASLGAATSTQNFGTTAATNTSQTASTSTITNPTSGTTYARAGATAPAAPIIVATNTPNPLGASGAYLKAVASSSTSVSKASPISGYTGSKEFYTSFKVLFGDSAGSTNATSGNWAFWQGAGANYTDNQQVGVTQAAVGLRFTYESSGAVSLSYAPTSGSTFLTNGLSSTSLTQGTVYNVEVVLFNGASGATKTYSYNGQTKTLSAGNCDFYINGVQFASNLTSGGLTLDTTINAATFTGSSSTSNAANLFVDDFVVYNAIPSSIGTSPGITPSGTFPALTTTYGTTSSSSNSVLVSGGSLTSNITATAPSNFQVSSDNTNWGGTAVYSNSGGFASGSLFLRLASNALAGTYSNQVVSLISGSASNSIAISNSTVNRYPITVGAVATNKVYGAADPALTYTNASLLFSDTFTGSLTRTAGTNAGTYTIGQGTLTNANYDITFLTNSFTITPKALTITADNVSKAFGVTLTTPQTGSTAFGSSGLVPGESISSVTITYTDGAGNGAVAGTYTGVVVPSAPVGINTNNYSITYNAGDLTVDAAPTITLGAASLPAFATTTYGTPSSTQNFTVLGGNLTGDVTVTAPAGFQVSTNASSGFGSSLTLTPAANAVPSTTIYVQIPGTANASTNYSGNISVTSDGATTRNVSIAASTVSPKTLTIGGLSVSNRVYDASTAGTVSGTAVYVGLTNSQTFPVTDTVTWTFESKNVGTNKLLSPSASFTAPSANYTVTQPTNTFSADITQATLTLSGAAATSRAYAVGNTNVTITGTLSGVLSNDVVGFTGTGTIASANAGTNIPVTPNVTLTGADAGNYSLTQPTGLTVDISKASNTITFGALSNVTVGSTNALSATVNSGLPLTYTSANTAVATISGSNVVAVAPGVTTITASQAGDSNVEAATPVSQTLNVAAVVPVTTLLSENFNGMSTNSTLPAGFRIQASTTTVAWASGSNTVTQVATSNNMSAGGTYNFGATTNERAVGAMTSGSFGSPNNLLAVVTNTSGSTQGSFSVSFVVERFRVNTAAASVLFFASTNGSTWTAVTSGDVATNSLPTGSSTYTWTNPTVVSRSGIAVTNFSVANNGLLYLRWNIDTTGGSSQAIAIDDVQVTTSGSEATPAITPNGTFPTLTTTYGTPSSSSNSVLVSGGSLTSNITATAPSNFQVSADNTNWGSTAVYTNSGGFASGSLFLRLASNALAGTYSNQVVALASGSASNSVAIATSTVNPYSITVGAVATNKVYGAADPAFTYTSTPLLFSDSLSGSLGRAAGENVGTYAINQGTLANPNYSISFTGANLTITAASLPAISWNGGAISNSNGVASFSLAYSGRNSNGINTAYSNSVAPSVPGYYTVVATSTDGNYSGSSTNNFFIAGPVLADDTGASTYELRKPQDNSQFYIDMDVVLANDKRIDSSGAVQTNGLTITGATGLGGSTALWSSPYIIYTPTSAATDSFTYTVSDGVVSATATVTVTPETNVDVPSFTLQFVKKGTAVFTNGNTVVSHDFIGVPNKSYALEYSTNISAPTNWVSAGSINTGGTGSFTATLTATNTNVATPWNASMFFRAKVNP